MCLFTGAHCGVLVCFGCRAKAPPSAVPATPTMLTLILQEDGPIGPYPKHAVELRGPEGLSSVTELAAIFSALKESLFVADGPPTSDTAGIQHGAKRFPEVKDLLASNPSPLAQVLAALTLGKPADIGGALFKSFDTVNAVFW